MHKTLVTASTDPDIDGLACGLAYAVYLQAKDAQVEVTAAFAGTPHPEARFVAESVGLEIPILDPSAVFDGFILVDASEPHGLPGIVAHDKVIEIIDHRFFADFSSFPNAKFRVEPIGAAATQIAEFYYFDDSVALSPELAALLLCGICSNTVNFKADTATFRDERMHQWLQTVTGERFAGLSGQMYDFKSQYVLDHLEEVLRLDAKDSVTQFNFDSPVAAFQIETNNAQPVLEREGEILELMQKLFPERHYQLLMVQDAVAGKTHILSKQPEVRELLQRSKLQPEAGPSESGLVLPRIVIRKSVLQAAKEAAKQTN